MKAGKERPSGSWLALIDTPNIRGFIRSEVFDKLLRSFPEKAITISYTVRPPETLKGKIFFLLGIIDLLSFPAMGFMIFKQKLKLQQQEQKAKEARLKLESVRAQLNPHFVYNALSGIQNLLRKNDNNNANSYLTKFSRLSRKILNNSEKEFVKQALANL